MKKIHETGNIANFFVNFVSFLILPYISRPKTTFNWFINPLKTFVFFIWKKYKKYIIALLILAVLLVFLILILYTLPGQISTLIVNG